MYTRAIKKKTGGIITADLIHLRLSARKGEREKE